MEVSAIKCRAQQAYHLDRAARTELGNVRVISERAAKAWGQEADWAERREAKRRSEPKVAVPDEDLQKQLSENPDRGSANP